MEREQIECYLQATNNIVYFFYSFPFSSLCLPTILSCSVTLPFVAVAALLVAWYFEPNRRGWKQWLADNAKQGFSAGTTHGVGTLIAVELRDLVPDVDECDW